VEQFTLEIPTRTSPGWHSTSSGPPTRPRHRCRGRL